MRTSTHTAVAAAFLLAHSGLLAAQSPTGANRLYESAGMHVSARFEIYEKVVG